MDSVSVKKLDFLECAICLATMTRVNNRLLPCQHTFCKECLESVYDRDSGIRCPQCRQVVNCKVDELPKNLTFGKILDALDIRPDSSEKQSNDCQLENVYHQSSLESNPINESSINLENLRNQGNVRSISEQIQSSSPFITNHEPSSTTSVAPQNVLIRETQVNLEVVEQPECDIKVERRITGFRSCVINLTIKNLSQFKGRSVFTTSTTFNDSVWKFKLVVPKTFTSRLDKNIGLYAVCRPSNLSLSCWRFDADVKFSLVSQYNEKFNHRKGFRHTFTSNTDTYGFASFIGWLPFTDKRKAYKSSSEDVRMEVEIQLN